MAEQSTGIKMNPIGRILQVLKLEKKEITAIYFYAILNGIVQLSLPLGIQSIISFVLGGSISTSLVILIILVVLGVLFNGFLSVNQMRLNEKVQQKLFVRYSFEYANRIPKLDLQSVDSFYLPELVNRFFDTISLQKSISKLLLEIPTASIQILFGTILLSFYHPVFIVFSLVLISLVSVILYFTSPRGLSTSIEESNYKYKVAGWLEELARVVRSFKFSKGTLLNLKKTDELVGGYLNARTAHFKVLLFQYWTLIGFKMLITAAMLIVGSILLINQQLNLGQFIASEIVILLVLNSVEKLIVNLDKVYDVLTSVEKLSKVIDQPVDAEGKMQLMDRIEGVSVQVQGLSFKYDKRPVLKNISFNVEPGQKVALIGEDGSGKSTLLRVLSGAYKNYEGGILLDNVPLKNYHSDSVRKNTGILLSQQDIFNGTILENITMGNNEISPNAIMLLSEKVGLKNFLEEQHEGFETVLDPVGKRLSRNIIQKILLLRALVNDPRLLLLEEPWSNLDESHRRSIQEYLFENNKDCTVVVATTSDDEFVSKCDKVLYLKDGQLVDAGSWDETRKN
ncbi:MAG TPA: ATP-binding cassette domain-containing protein [Chitinophagaceae bacterium]|nr:ATP-binding cassette domain-containing protein [Chitinophagaceae bacterium]